MNWHGPDDWRDDLPQDDECPRTTAIRWPLSWRGLLPRERWLWFERLWTDVCSLRERYRLAVRSEWWEDEIQVEALAALAAWTERYDSGEWDDPPGKLALLFDLERVAALLRDGRRPVPSRPRPHRRSCAISSTSGASRRRADGRWNERCGHNQGHVEPVEAQRRAALPLGAAVTLSELDQDPHPVLARLRAAEPVSWLPSLEGWLVTRHDLVAGGDARRADVHRRRPAVLHRPGGRAEHAQPRRRRARSPPRAVRGAVPRRCGGGAVRADHRSEADRLIDELAPAGAGELRRAFAGPMAAAIVTRALGLGRDEVADVLAWYDAIVASVTSITAGTGATAAGEEAFADLSDRLRAVIGGGDDSSLLAAAAGAGALSTEQIVSNAAVLLFGGIETTEGMIANAALYLLAEPATRAGGRAGRRRRRWARRSTSRCGWSRRRR